VIHRFVILLAAAFSGALAPNPAEAADPPNVVLIVADDYGWMDVGANNPDSFYDTPALDALAASGANFTSGYANCPVCSPSRVSLMTGRDPVRTATTSWFHTEPLRNARFRTAEYVNQLPLSATTLADRLGEAGYRTAFFGKWPLGHERDRWPDERGYEINIGGFGMGGPGKGGYFAPYRADMPNMQEAPEGEHLPARLTDEAIAWMNAEDDRPFLLTLWYYSVHTPLEGREDLIEKYEARKRQLGYSDEDRWGEDEQVWPWPRENGTPRRVRERQDHQVYGAMVEAMDEHIGRLLDALERSGLADDTLVIFTSDNGGLSSAEGSPTSNLPLRGGKGWLYEGGIRVPFFVRWPGVTRPGMTIDAPANGADVFETIIDAAGLGPKDTDGVSVRPLLEGDPADAERMLFWHYPHYSNQGGHPGGAVRKGKWKLIRHYEDGEIRLYDLEADIGERHNVAEKHPEIVRELTAALHAYLEASNARFLRPIGADDADRPWRPAYLGR